MPIFSVFLLCLIDREDSRKTSRKRRNRNRRKVTYRFTIGNLKGRVEVYAARVVERIGGRGLAAGVVGGGRRVHTQVAVDALDLENVHELRPSEHSPAEEHGLDDADHEDDDSPGEGELEVRVLVARHAGLGWWDFLSALSPPLSTSEFLVHC